MRLTAVLLLYCSLQISEGADAQNTFECHVQHVPFQQVLDIIRVQTHCTFFFQNERSLKKSIVSMDEKRISIEDFLKNYLGVAADEFTHDGNNYFIKRKHPSPFRSKLPPPPPVIAPVSSPGSSTGEKSTTLPGVIVVPLSNGYQHIPKERITGSFGYIDQAAINGTVSTSITERMENILPGLLSNHGQSSNGIPIKEIPQIRGLSTIYANASPLFVLDNFPYDGDINNINPNDIESFTVLKDAAAASIWGVRAGNGVIIINTRHGKLCDSNRTLRPVFSYNSSITFQAKPDINNVSTISSADFIQRERDLFNAGYYPSDNTTPFTPVVSILTDSANGLISATTATSMIDVLKNQRVQRDIEKYFYRGSVTQQHFLQASAGAGNAAYYFSTGWDHNLYGLAGSSYDRVTMKLQNILKISPRLMLETGVNFVHTTTRSNGNPGFNYRSRHGGKGFYPYAQLADAQSNPQSLSMDYNPAYLQAAKQLGFADWTYTPLRDVQQEDNIAKVHELLVNLGGRYSFTSSLNVEVKYQYENGGANGSNLHHADSYYTRDLINRFVQVDPATNQLSSLISPGGILDLSNQETVVHQGRLQINFSHTWSHRNNLSVIGGYEIKSLISTAHFDREYGYNPEDGNYAQHIDYAGIYSGYQLFNPDHIPSGAPTTKQVDHFIGYYLNGSYTYRNLYTLSASAREDAANLFGVKTNQKGVPLWSTGVAWQIDRESFYNPGWLSSLRLRATFGRNGNISRLASAYTTATYSPGGFTGTPFTIGYITGLPNPNLRWEQVKVLNIGLDLAKGKTLSGSIEYYKKNATDLMAPVPGDPTLGLIQNPGVAPFYYANSASMTGSGLDLQLEARILDGESANKLRWALNFIFSKTVSKVHTYLLTQTIGNAYLDQGAISPHPGQPIYSIFSYAWRGLSSAGDPMGYYNGKSSNDWTNIYTKTLIDSMVYNGPSQPTVFGALKNTFEWRHFTASFNISYKLGYYFRRPSISYSDLFSTWTGNGDYARRWQHAGDETKTIVPSVGDPIHGSRDLFYLKSSVLVEKADHIRLEDILFSYDLQKKDHAWVPFEKIRFYTYLSNLGILWRANRSGIDPYYINIPREGRRYSFGMNINF